MSGPPPTAGLSRHSRTLAGVLLILLPTAAFGGTSLLTAIINDPAYLANELRQDLWRAGHAHAGVLLVLALLVLRYVDEAHLGPHAKSFVRHSVPAAAILLPAAFFLSVLSPEATEPNHLINLAYLGALSLTAGTLTLGVGLLRRGRDAPQPADGPRRERRENPSAGPGDAGAP